MKKNQFPTNQRILRTMTRALNTFFQKLILRLTCGLGRALCFIANKISSFFVMSFIR